MRVVIQISFVVIYVISQVLSFQKLFPQLNVSFPIENNSLCSDNARILSQELENQELWAMRMLDASGQGSSSALYGLMWQLGNFDECLSIEAPFATKYCLVTIQVELKHPQGSVWKYLQETTDGNHLARNAMHTAVCVPSSCSSSQLEEAFQEQLDLNNSSQVQYKVTVNHDLCTSTVDVGPLQVSEIFFWITCGLICFFVLMGTIVRNSTQNTFLFRFLRCFSLPCNVHRLFHVSTEESAHPLAALHGVKVISIILIFYGHRSSMPLGMAVSNYQEIEELLKTAHNMFLPQTDLVVDTFFFISGVLATYILYQMLSKKAINPFHAIIARILRIAPAYYLLVWFQASAAMRLGSGPMWQNIQHQESSNCVHYWWANIFFINNYLPAQKMCHIHSWFLPCDLHFFMLAIILVFLLVKKPLIGKIVLSSLTVLTPLVPAFIVYAYSLHPMVIFNDSFLSNPRSSTEFDMLYVKSHVRVTVYLIGILVGYFLYLQNASKYKMTKAVTAWSLVLGVSLLFTPMAVGGLYYQHDPPSVAFSAVYAALRRPFWALGLSVLLMVHRFGPGNMISSMLSSHLALVLSKLTFTIYLIHYVLILCTMAKRRTPSVFSVFDLAVQGSGDLVTTCAYSVILYIFLELPAKRMFRELTFRKQSDNTTEDSKTQTTSQEIFTAKL